MIIEFLNEHRLLIALLVGLIVAFGGPAWLWMTRSRVVEVPLSEDESRRLDGAIQYLSAARGVPVERDEFTQEALIVYDATVERCGKDSRVVVERDGVLEDITDKIFPKGVQRLKAGP